MSKRIVRLIGLLVAAGAAVGDYCWEHSADYSPVVTQKELLEAAKRTGRQPKSPNTFCRE